MAECIHGCEPADFVERMGLFWEAEGLPRIAGRLYGFLVLETEPCSLDEMAAALAVSKASVSTDIRRLEQLGLVERQSRPGDRRDYYVIAPDVTVRMIALRRARIEQFRAMIDSMRSRGDDSPVVRDRLRTMQVVHHHLTAALDAIAHELQTTGLASPPTNIPNPTSRS